MYKLKPVSLRCIKKKKYGSLNPYELDELLRKFYESETIAAQVIGSSQASGFRKALVRVNLPISVIERGNKTYLVRKEYMK